MVANHYRVTKYNPVLRDRNDIYFGDEWTDRHDIGVELAGHVLTEDEFEATINKYLYAVEAFAHESGVTHLTVVDLVEKVDTREPPWASLRKGATVSLDQALELVRSMLRGEVLGPKLEDGDRFYVHVHDRMYMWIGSDVDCVQAVSEAERIGLFVEPGQVSWLLPDPADRFRWLREGEPVHHILVSVDRRNDDRRHRDIPDDKVPALRALFSLNRDDEHFYDSYEIDESRWAPVSEILGIPLDPAIEYTLWTRSGD